MQITFLPNFKSFKNFLFAPPKALGIYLHCLDPLDFIRMKPNLGQYFANSIGTLLIF